MSVQIGVVLHLVGKTSEQNQRDQKRNAKVCTGLGQWQDRPHFSPSAIGPKAWTALKVPCHPLIRQFKPLCVTAGGVLISERERAKFPSKEFLSFEMSRSLMPVERNITASPETFATENAAIGC